jgi:LmbE family N-acetylglucosaminyl deacetylase
MASPHSNRAVDVTATFERKIAALRQHKSQIGDGSELEERLRGWLSANAQAAGLEEGYLAELFQVVQMPPSGSA